MSGSAKEGQSDAGPGLFDQPLVVQGKRKRKGIETFAITHEAKRPVLEYKGGSGVKLGDIAQIENYIKRHASEELKPLHRICLDRPGSKLEVKKNLREFTGFTFEKDSEQYLRKKASLDKLTKAGLRVFLEALNLPVTGSKEEQMERILDFLLNPQNLGRVPAKRRRKSSANKRNKVGRKKAKLSSGEDDGTEEEADSEGEIDADSEGEEEAEAEEEEEGEGETLEETKEESIVLKEPETCKEPEDSELMETVKAILKDADLQKATTKSVCLQVYAKYPRVDLTKRKNYIVSCIEVVTASL